jgi:hypothetical protein
MHGEDEYTSRRFSATSVGFRLPASHASTPRISACGATLLCLTCAATIWADKGLELPMVEDRQQQQLTVTVRTVFTINRNAQSVGLLGLDSCG